MVIEIHIAAEEQKPVIRNLGLLYAYDMSRYCGHYDIWRMPENGIYEEGFAHLDSYWQDPKRFPYLVRVDGELAGFVMVNDVALAADFAIAEFFITAKYQRHGIGSYVAKEIFAQHLGKWEVTVIPDNKLGGAFWDKVIASVSHGQFTKKLEMLPSIPIPLYVYRFNSLAIL